MNYSLPNNARPWRVRTSLPSLVAFAIVFLAGVVLAGPRSYADGLSPRSAGGAVSSDTYPVSPDGAVDVNINWEQGTSSNWYIELQRYGAIVVQDGVDQENDAMIRQGLTIIDWGFSHQVADGSFAANGALTAGGDTGSAFHSTVLFVEAAARTALVLKSYAPTTYTPDSAFYAGVVSSYSAKLASACAWLRRSDVAAAGVIDDAPFTHRRYLLAAAFAETGTLDGDGTLVSAATPFVQDGLSLQLTSGSEQVTYPDHSVRTISLVGVNPELNGFDVNYQEAGILFAERYYKYCTSSTLKNQLKLMMQAGLGWEAPRVSVTGAVDTVGSTRVGIELNRDGTVKQMNTTELRQALNGGYKLVPNHLFKIAANRLLTSWSVSPDVIAADGSSSYNTAWEHGTNSTWSISLQKDGTDYVTNGISLENDALIRKGLLILDWGFAHEAADGTFPTTASPFYGGAQFIEAAARAALALKGYSPVTYQADTAFYQGKVAQYQSAIELVALNLTQPAVAAHGQVGIGASTARWFGLAAALAQSGSLTGDTSLYAAALPYATHAQGLQLANGTYPENGAVDVNYQAISVTYAARYYIAYPTKSASLAASCIQGLRYEGTWVSLTGIISGTPAPATRTIDIAFTYGENTFGDHTSAVVANRIEANFSQSTGDPLD